MDLTTVILNIINGIVQIQLSLPVDVRIKQAEEFQADLDGWRKLLGLYVPNIPVAPQAPPPGAPHV